MKRRKIMKEIKVGLATCGIAAGGMLVYDELKKEIKNNNIEVELKKTGCMGMCYREVLIEVKDDSDSYLYANVTPDKVKQIVYEHIINKKPVKEWIIKSKDINKEDAFFKKQKQIVLRNCGIIDPSSVDDYISNNGYKAIQKCLNEYSKMEVIDIIIKSGLRGRGGGGFSTGLKWKFASQAAGDKKYVICNADEGDPGAFMDRSTIEGDPHSIIEGMMIAGYAIQADEAYIYVRAEYPLAIERLLTAIKQCEDRGFLGKNIFNSNMDFKIRIKEGAGAFVCGEETALISSIEGKRGVPRIRPPFPANKGLWGKPTNINNVETYANIPWIIMNGPQAFSSMGTDITINEIIYDIGGGIVDGKKFKAVQMGGPSGGCIPASMGDLKIDYDEITKTGAIMGSGGLIVLDETTCMVDLAKFFLNFTQNESCGKCTFCRIGTKRMLEILERITAGAGKEGDIQLLEELAYKIKNSSLCGLGQTAPNPVLTTIKYFRDEYEAHIKEKRCPAHSCVSLLTYTIIEDKCVGCTLCAQKCPVNAISGKTKEPHKIKQDACIKCGLCYDSCKFDAIEKI
jgi:NADH-quinone oxidoreductase subunit F